MSIDVKKLLYRHKQFIEAKKNAETSLRYLQEDYRRYRADENWYIRGSLPSNRIETGYIQEEDTVAKVEIIEDVIRKLSDVINTVKSAVETLDDERKELVQLRYFDSKKPEYVRQKMAVSETTYYHIQKLALDDMSKCFSTKLWTDDYLDRLLFIPLMERFEQTKKMRSFSAVNL